MRYILMEIRGSVKGLRSDRTTPLQMTSSETLILVPTLTFFVGTDPGGGGTAIYGLYRYVLL